RGVVGGEVMPADQARDRRDVHDRAAGALHQLQAVFAAEERAVDVDRHGAAEIRVARIFDRAELGDAGRVDQAIEPSRARLDLPDRPRPVRLGGDVEQVVEAVAAGKTGVDRDSALAHARLRDRRADCARTAGDENDLVAQAAHGGLQGDVGGNYELLA